VLMAVLEYVRGGGTAVLCNNFPGAMSSESTQNFFASAGLPWELGAYHRTTFHLNPDADLVADSALLLSTLPWACNMNAVQLSNVADGDAWFRPNATSKINTLASRFGGIAAEPVTDLKNTGAACAKVGLGKLGYVGDVNSEEDSVRIMLAMLGL
ncbi:hypothetical protein B0T22DRAFT_349821, partial [Podospora appendiculata]